MKPLGWIAAFVAGASLAFCQSASSSAEQKVKALAIVAPPPHYPVDSQGRHSFLDGLPAESRHNVPPNLPNTLRQYIAEEREKRPRGRKMLGLDFAAQKRPNQALERTADRCDDLLSMTSKLNPEARRALVSGRSASSR